MQRKEVITEALNRALEPLELWIEDESGMHNVPAGAESHFRIELVSDHFKGMSMLARHRAVYAALNEVMPQIHALALHTRTPEEKASLGAAAPSPPCLGGGKG